MLGTIETTIGYIPFTEIDLDTRATRFRTPDPDDILRLKAALLHSGQTHPIVLEKNEDGRYSIVDGHRRCDALDHIRQAGGTWEKILAQVVPAGRLSPAEKFRILKTKNFDGENKYRVDEQGRYFRAFLAQGVSVQQIARECAMTVHAVEDMLELADVKPELGKLLHENPLEPVYAVMLHRRYEACLRSPYAGHAITVAAEILASIKNEFLSMKTWKFLLDFYWGPGRPFMTD